MRAEEHHIGDNVRLVRPETQGHTTYVRVLRLSDGFYLNFTTGEFSAVDSNTITAENPKEHEKAMLPLWSTPMVSLNLTQIPPTAAEYLVVYRADTSYDYEYHRYGASPSVSEPVTCRVYGTVRDVSGFPVSGQVVIAKLNNGGYFPHKSGFIGVQATAVTDESGKFEIRLVPGLDVMISIPGIGYTKRGIVPPKPSVEIDSFLTRF